MKNNVEIPQNLQVSGHVVSAAVGAFINNYKTFNL